jgi:DNA-binding response OmpR family regulator
MNLESNKNDEVLKKLFAIRKSWAKNLPEKLKEINSAWKKLQDGAWDGDLFQQLHRKVHTIAGSGGTFGFPEIGIAAREAEILIKPLQQEAREPSLFDRDEISQKLEYLLDVCDQALKKAVPPPPSGNLEKVRKLRTKDQAEHLIYLVEDDAELAQELKNQLELHQFSVCWHDTLGAFKTAFKEKEPAVVIMDIVLPDGDGTEVLTKLQRYRQEPINTIFISVNDDINNRLNAIRAGSEIFLNKPLDISEIVKKLGEYLTNEDSEAFRILIIDDSIDLSNHYSMLLQEAGMETSIINDPLQTFDRLVDFIPDLILLDLYMPECSGQELAQLIRQREAYISIPIVFLSSERDIDSQLRALNLGGDDFLNKSMEAEYP